MLEEFIDYVYVNTHEDNLTNPIKLLTGEFADVIMCFGTLKVEESNEDEATISFTFKVLEPGSRRHRKRLEKSSTFKKHLCVLLESILEENTIDNEVGEINIKEFDPERRIREEDYTIPEE